MDRDNMLLSIHRFLHTFMLSFFLKKKLFKLIFRTKKHLRDLFMASRCTHGSISSQLGC